MYNIVLLFLLIEVSLEYDTRSDIVEMIFAPELIERLLCFKCREILILLDYFYSLWHRFFDPIDEFFEYLILLAVWIVPYRYTDYDRVYLSASDGMIQARKKVVLIDDIVRYGYTHIRDRKTYQ